MSAGPDLLYRSLAEPLGEGAVFLDKQSIVAGARWEVSIEEALAASRCLVLIFGERWDDVAVPRLATPGEVLYREITSARDAGIPTMPVFIGDMPRRLDLPEPLRFLGDVHWERIAAPPTSTETDSVALRIIDTLAREDVAGLTVDRHDPVVAGIAHLTAMRPAFRTAVAAALERISDPGPREVVARELVAIVRAAVDGARPEVVNRSDLTRPLLMCADLDPSRADPAILRAVRAVIRPILTVGRGSPGALDRELLRVLDAVLSRSLAIRTGDGTRDFAGIVQAGRYLAEQPKRVQQLHREARRFLVDELLFGLDEQTRTAVLDLRSTDRIRSRPGPAAGRARVTGRARRRRR